MWDTVRALPTPAGSARLADAAAAFLDTISVANTRRSYATALNRMVRDFGADTNVAMLSPDRVVRYRVGERGQSTANGVHDPLGGVRERQTGNSDGTCRPVEPCSLRSATLFAIARRHVVEV